LAFEQKRPAGNPRKGIGKNRPEVSPGSVTAFAEPEKACLAAGACALRTGWMQIAILGINSSSWISLQENSVQGLSFWLAEQDCNLPVVG